MPSLPNRRLTALSTASVEQSYEAVEANSASVEDDPRQGTVLQYSETSNINMTVAYLLTGQLRNTVLMALRRHV